MSVGRLRYTKSYADGYHTSNMQMRKHHWQPLTNGCAGGYVCAYGKVGRDLRQG